MKICFIEIDGLTGPGKADDYVEIKRTCMPPEQTKKIW